MRCPKCGDDYRDDYVRCADCDVDLIAEPPADELEGAGWRDMVNVCTVSDSAFLMVAKSILEDAAIPYWAKNEGVQDLFGFGRLGTGFNILTGPIELHVPREFAEDATRLLHGEPQAESP
jgi:hypothetical protein